MKKSKKIEDSFFPQQLHQDSQSGVYAEVDHTMKIKREADATGNIEEAPSDNTIKLDLNPVYGKISSHPETTHASVSETVGNCTNNNNKINNKKQQKSNISPLFALACLVVLITAVAVATVAVGLTVSNMSDLRTDLNNFIQKLDQLQIDLNSFSSNTSDLLVGIRQNTSESDSNWRQQANITLEMIQSFDKVISLQKNNMRILNNTLDQQISRVDNATSFTLQNLEKELDSIKAASNDCQSSIITLMNTFARGIQILHTFSSCAAVFNFSTQLPPGYYMITSGGSVSEEYCINACNDIHGGWKRIAYLNTEENLVTCPDGFEVRNDTSNPPLCRRTNTSAGCSSVIFPSSGMSYSQVCGTVRVHPAGTPDAFFFIKRNDQSVNQNYVDGVSLTYGNNSNRNHIWTYTSATRHRILNTLHSGCEICNHNKPTFIGTDFTCTIASCDDENVCRRTLWGNETQQCFGNETFYRQLSESTIDNIEMRVCRDQGRSDEDILMSFLELFVM